MEILAERLGIHCITRTEPGGAKAGNINNALRQTRNPLVVIFDADFCPRADFLAQSPYENAWAAMVEATGAKPEYFYPRKGQALIWAANLLHGGSRQNDPGRTRWSQVTHYYFDDCAYFTPAFSDPLVGNLDLRQIVDITTGELAPNIYVDRPVDQVVRRGAPPAPVAQSAPVPGKLPKDFDPALYLSLNPDVAAAGADARKHYLRFGMRENRRYR
ncbi:MAG: hypothetical protein B7Y78_02910 [Caulobacter sp. 35-67-4]|nr:MAG: hypothetical protein B7Y78_02910 [Caulobacter sp. 35-67-4]